MANKEDEKKTGEKNVDFKDTLRHVFRLSHQSTERHGSKCLNAANIVCIHKMLDSLICESIDIFHKLLVFIFKFNPLKVVVLT